MGDKKVMYKMTRDRGDFCVWKHVEGIASELDRSEVGDIVQIEIVSMTDEEFDDLGEFEGW
jgi:hypothetical protein